MKEKQIKAKKRVADHGEVFTSEREVNAMIDLVKHETENIDSRFLEPACGNGNFLAEILRRKLAVVKKKYKKSKSDYEKFSVLAVSSIYGVDILLDNVVACRERLFTIWYNEYKAVCKKEVNEDCLKAVRFILVKNIVCGNALSLKKVDEYGFDTDEPIVFSEWSMITGSKIQRKDYRFDKLLEGDKKGRDIFQKEQKEKRNDEIEQLSIFKELQVQKEQPDYGGELLKQYILQHYRRVWEYGE